MGCIVMWWILFGWPSVVFDEAAILYYDIQPVDTEDWILGYAAAESKND